MKASVNIASAELKRLFLKSVKEGGFSEAVVSESLYKLLARVEKDYPHLLKNFYQTAQRKHQLYLADQLKKQRKLNMSRIYGEIDDTY